MNQLQITRREVEAPNACVVDLREPIERSPLGSTDESPSLRQHPSLPLMERYSHSISRSATVGVSTTGFLDTESEAKRAKYLY